MKSSPAIPTLADRLAAVSEPVRLRICHILEQAELSVGEVSNVIQLPQSTVSRHLKTLADTNWVTKRAEGTAKYYRLLQDDLPEDTRALWRALRQHLGADPLFDEDAVRLKVVLAERRYDSLAFFGRVAGEWDRLRQELFGQHFTAPGLLALLPPDWIVADIGCGTGNVAEILSPCVQEVIAVDPSEPMLRAARKRLADCRNIRFAHGSLSDLPVDDASAHAATLVLVLHHVSDPENALREVRRILKPDGRILIIDMLEHDHTIFKQSMGHAHLGFNPDTVKQLLSDAGFTNPRIAPLPTEATSRGPGLFVATANNPSTR